MRRSRSLVFFDWQAALPGGELLLGQPDPPSEEEEPPVFPWESLPSFEMSGVSLVPFLDPDVFKNLQLKREELVRQIAQVAEGSAQSLLRVLAARQTQLQEMEERRKVWESALF